MSDSNDASEISNLGADVDKEVLDEEPRSILLGLISQLRKDMDLHRVTLPTFVLEPRSMCERITDFMSHPQLILGTSKKDDPMERFIDVVRYYLSGWHIKPKGVKKPYNPVLGEFFRCRYKLEDQTEAIYVCEQVSHHPPISAYFYASPDNNLVIEGDLRPKSRFLGNSAATIMGGGSRIRFLNRPGEEYHISLPNMYVRGILFGTMYLELGDEVTIQCPELDLTCELEFKTKGFFSGTYNGIAGKIKRESSGDILYKISGKWSEVIFISAVGKKGCQAEQVLFDVSKEKCSAKIVQPECEQEEFESRRLWSRVTKAIGARNMDDATDEKTAIEDNQRRAGKERTVEEIHWQTRFFEPSGPNWKLRLGDSIYNDPAAAKKALADFIYSPAQLPQHQKFWLDESAGSPTKQRAD
ncbi:uncharacterized protein BJ171DRAFT_211736 [Polychytrium aggregatum]|uniref:uncharacterized protein n=1 Tax=Polychytrium aggregatum TaxID=110093 RepID=UPI0022FE5431|nr:uncharacterized protein BJ171DRAFT_211736 [Polychytrium aggregatum]KAI9208664.1 hypothetical protein BJ171DRAFT_211736 [Polychytrium aggregatum]